MPDLEAFDTDHLPPHLHDVGEPFRELMLACQFNVPPGAKLDEAVEKLLESRNLVYEAVIQARREDRECAKQLSFELGMDDPGALRFPSWPHIPPSDEADLA